MERINYPIFFRLKLLFFQWKSEGELSFLVFSTNVGLLASYLSLKAVHVHASSTCKLEYTVNVLIVLSLR